MEQNNNKTTNKPNSFPNDQNPHTTEPLPESERERRDGPGGDDEN